MKKTANQILHGFRDMRNGGKFFIDGDKFMSISSYTFEQVANGSISSITFKENGEMPPSNDATGNPRPVTKAFIVEDVELTELGSRLINLRDLKVQVEEKRVKKDLEAI